MRERRHTRVSLGLAIVFLITGVLHFVAPGPFESIVPGFLGAPRFWVYASGVAELGCSALLAAPSFSSAPRSTRLLGGWASVVLLVGVYPANITMAVQSLQGHGSVLIAFARLPLQVPLVLWALWIAQDGRLRRRSTTRG